MRVIMSTRSRLMIAFAAATLLSGCGAFDRMSNIGQPPKLSPIKNIVEKPGYKPVRMPMPQPVAIHHQPNSLWRSGSRAFFKDQRARRIGDILTVTVKIDDKAKLENTTKRSRSNAENANLPAFLGFANPLQRVLSKLRKLAPGEVDPGKVAELDSTSSSEGSGEVDRTEDLETTIAAVVTQVLPNGNLVIQGRQEVRVNFEVRELIVAGIIRAEDISADNTIPSTKIAEARIAYGGRGQISDVQQPRYGQQVLDIVLPF